MKLSKQHKVYVSVLGLALGVLAADKLFFGPQEAAAESAETLLVSSTAGDAAATVTAAEAATDIPVANRVNDRLISVLAALSAREEIDPDGVHDVFTPAWGGTAVAVPVGTLGGQSRRVTDFVQAHRLTAVMGSGPSGSAIVDGRFLRIGQTLDGMKLVAIGERAATFEADGVTVDLRIPFEAPASGTLANSDQSSQTEPDSETGDR